MRKEKIVFERAVTVSDGMGGTILSGSEPVYSCMAEVTPLKGSRQLEANQVALKQGYQMVMWIDSQFEPRALDTIVYRDERLTMQEYRYADEARRRYLIIAMEQ